MMRVFALAAVSINLLLWLAASPNESFAVKDQTRIDSEPEKTPSATSPFSPHNNPENPPGTPQEPGQQDDPGQVVPFDVLTPDDIPVIETLELTMDIAKRAVDALAEVRDKYNEKGIDDYETLEEFVAATPAGKQLQADVVKFGFSNITDWNTSITSVGFAYSAVNDDEESEIRSQISDIKADPGIEADAKAKMIASLEAMIASANNKSIVRQLMQDQYYAAKLKLLDETE